MDFTLKFAKQFKDIAATKAISKPTKNGFVFNTHPYHSVTKQTTILMPVIHVKTEVEWITHTLMTMQDNICPNLKQTLECEEYYDFIGISSDGIIHACPIYHKIIFNFEETTYDDTCHMNELCRTHE